MVHRKSEILGFYYFNSLILKAISNTLIHESVLRSKYYIKCTQSLMLIIKILEPLANVDIKELALIFFRAFISKYTNIPDVEIDKEWDKYAVRLKSNMKARMPEIIGLKYEEYGLQDTKLNLGDGIEVPLTTIAFIERYQIIDAKWYPENLVKAIKAIKDIKRDLQDSIYPRQKTQVKEYKSLKRVRAFYLYQMYLDGLVSDQEISSKKRIIQISDQEFPVGSGKTTYEALKTDKFPIFYSKNAVEEIKKVRNTFKLDYEYGLKLYSAKFQNP